MPTNIDTQAYALITRLIKEDFPKYRAYHKSESRLHRFIGWAARFPWFGKYRVNADYMTRYYTTFNGKIAVPDGNDPAEDFEIFPHEWRHLKQEKKYSALLWQPLYLLGLPVPLVALGLLALLLLPVWIMVGPWWVSMILLGTGALLSSPVPFGYWRAKWEFEAYEVSIATRYWLTGRVENEYLAHCAQEFTGSAYFWMWPYGNSALQKLQDARDRVVGRAIFNDEECGEFYRKLYFGLKELGLTRVEVNFLS